MVNLLHLSDLHFGYDKDATAKAQRSESLDLLVKEVRKVGADWKPHILVISGNLTWQGKASGYGELAEWGESSAAAKASRFWAGVCFLGGHGWCAPGGSPLAGSQNDEPVFQPEASTRKWARRLRVDRVADYVLGA